jgi:hypothetical protein
VQSLNVLRSRFLTAATAAADRALASLYDDVRVFRVCILHDVAHVGAFEQNRAFFASLAPF